MSRRTNSATEQVRSLAAEVNTLNERDFLVFLDLVRPVSAKECAAAIGASDRTFNRTRADHPDFPVLLHLAIGGHPRFHLGSVFTFLRGLRRKDPA